MKTKFIFIFLFPLSILFNQDYDENIIEIPKEDFIEIAESAIQAGNYDIAVLLYQQILNNQLSNLGLVHEVVASTSQKIGELLIMDLQYEDANIYFAQAIEIRARIIAQHQMEITPSLEFLREVYLNLDDTLKIIEIDKHIEMLKKIELDRYKDELWSPISIGLDFILTTEDSLYHSEISYQAFNLIEMADYYFDADLFYDGISSLVEALSIQKNKISISFLDNYIPNHILDLDTDQIIKKLKSYSSTDSNLSYRNHLLLSLIHYYRSEETKAMETINKYVQHYPNDSRGHILIGNYLYNQEQYIEALFHYQKTNILDADNIYSNLKQSQCLYELGYYYDAKPILSKIIKIDSENYDAYYLRGVINSKTNNPRNAISDFTTCILMNPENEAVYNHLGVSYYNIKKYDRAKESLTRYLKFNNEDGLAHYYLGVINENILDFENAISHYSQARKFNVDIDDVNKRLGMIYYNNNNFTSSIKPLTDYMIYNPDSLDVLEILADALYRDKKYELSIDAYQKLYKADSSKIDYLMIVANSYIELNNLSKAKDTLYKLFLFGKGNETVLMMLAEIENQLGNYDNAKGYYELAIDEANLNGGATLSMYYNLAMTYAALDDYESSLKQFNIASNMDPDDYEIIYQIALCNNELKNYNEAVTNFLHYINQFPEDEVAHYLLGLTYYNQMEYPLARKHFKKSISLNNSDYLYYYYTGMCNYYENKYEQAAKNFKKSIQIDATFPMSHYYLSISYYHIGKTQLSQNEQRKVRVLDSDQHELLIEEMHNIKSTK